MAKHCETFDHTADIGLRAEADTPEELMSALAEGLAELICPRAGVRAERRVAVRLEAEDREGLTVDFLWKVMSAVEYDGFAIARVDVHRAREKALEADLWGEDRDPARHEIVTEIKAVTYHQLKVAREAGRWTARVILDL
jgi:protein archease